MAATLDKKHKIQPLMRLRQLQLDQEMLVLNQIQTKRERATAELHHFQIAYIQGIDRLNKERQSPERKMLEALEQAVDYAKIQWYHKLKALRTIESEERLQHKLVADSHQRLRMLEKLDERYDQQHSKHEKVIEQKALDEFALQIARRKSVE